MTRAILLAAALISGCAPSPSGEPASSDSIPPSYHGVYDASLEACTRPSEYRLRVGARELRFHESIGTVREVAPEGPGAIRIAADFEGEGERWSATQVARLEEGGSRIVLTGRGTSLSRVRCPAGAER